MQGMTDKISMAQKDNSAQEPGNDIHIIAPNTLEIGRLETYEVVMNHPQMQLDKNGMGHIIFSPAQARNLACLLIKHALLCEMEKSGITTETAEQLVADVNLQAGITSFF